VLRYLARYVFRIAISNSHIVGLDERSVSFRYKHRQSSRWRNCTIDGRIHHPTDNTLLWDVVRVVTRLIGQLAETIEQRIKEFHNLTRAARRRMQALQRMTTTQRYGQQTGKYRELIAIAEEVVERAHGALRHTRNAVMTCFPRWRSRICDARSANTADWESA
jgi:Putative transposase